MKWNIEYSAITDTGEREKNQDTLTVWNKVIHDKNFSVFAVADGIGGLSDGEIASAVAINEVDVWAKKMCYQIENDEVIDPLYELRRLVDQSNQHIKSFAEDTDKAMGTTLTLLFFFDQFVYLCHVGDSIAYQLKDNIATIITESHVGFNGQRKGLTSCIGYYDHVRIKQIEEIAVETPCHFLLGSDGLFNTLNVQRNIDFITGKKSPVSILKRLVKNARLLGEGDNATGILIKVKDG